MLQLKTIILASSLIDSVDHTLNPCSDFYQLADGSLKLIVNKTAISKKKINFFYNVIDKKQL